MTERYNLQRFVKAQERTFEIAYNEIKSGKKASHWMWFIFPQLTGLGFSEAARTYGIADLKEAGLYLKHDVLGERLLRISKLLLRHEHKSAGDIFGTPDDLKLKSCMTLFSLAADTDPVFVQILARYFDGLKDDETLKLLKLKA